MLKQLQKFSKLDSQNLGGILIIDSGVGAVSLLYEVRKLLPDTPITVIADSAEFPYGKKSPQQIVQRVCWLAEFFLPLTKASTILLACNTASTVALPALRKRFHVPVVGIVPAVKPASVFSKSGTIALLATLETARGPYVDDLVNNFASHCKVIKIGCPNLASLAENKVMGVSFSEEEILNEIAPLVQHKDFDNVDSLLLGCTHFSFLSDELQSILGSSVKIFDPAAAVAKQVKRVHKESHTSAYTSLVFTSPVQVTDKSNLCVDALYYL